MNLLTIFNNWYDDLQEPYRFVMMFVVVSPWFLSLYINTNIALILGILYAFMLMVVRSYSKLQKLIRSNK